MQGVNIAEEAYAFSSMNLITAQAATAPTSWAAMNAGTPAGAIPAKLSLSDLAMVIAGLAKLVEEVNQ